MAVNDDAGSLTPRGALRFFASKLAPTEPAAIGHPWPYALGPRCLMVHVFPRDSVKNPFYGRLAKIDFTGTVRIN
ncbi:hypothetical protein AB7M25_004187 [Pseudomonas sp. AP3_22 TE3818]